MPTLTDHPGEEARTVQGRPDDLDGCQTVGIREVDVGGPGAGQLARVRPGDLAGEDPEAIAFMLDHGEAKAVIVDPEFSGTMAKALALRTPPRPCA